ncbi:hypothetical protein PROFUN_11612 [Planoprotostelium fungivorum]|uniref:SH2 domain-containing protein n=1 Tax=Planoprotostelium fungivorum TaxID=1890364 RepID=A0A2P6N2C8_9EUKA|nr:hypothetical protein PROFUN_11612 [Planoprotostelium fungivorum]
MVGSGAYRDGSNHSDGSHELEEDTSPHRSPSVDAKLKDLSINISSSKAAPALTQSSPTTTSTSKSDPATTSTGSLGTLRKQQYSVSRASSISETSPRLSTATDRSTGRHGALRKSGTLYKKVAGTFGSSWKKMFGILIGDALCLYKNESDESPKEMITELKKYKVFEPDERTLSLNPVTGNIKPTQFRVDDPTEKRAWITQLAKVCAKQLTGAPSGIEIASADLAIEGEALGRGASGTVFRGIWLKNTLVAVKTMSDIDNEEEMQNFLSEIDLLSKLRHPQIVTMYGFCHKKEKPNSTSVLCLVTEFVSGGNLSALIHKSDMKFNNHMIIDIATEISKGMTYLHGEGVEHRDLKPANVLIHELTSEKIHLKICDFGLSAGEDDSSSTVVLGTPSYAAPELCEMDHTFKVDVYSYAIILWELQARKHVWDDIVFGAEIAARVSAGQRPDLQPDWPLANLTEKCWDHDPEQRPDFATVDVMLRTMKQTLALLDPHPSIAKVEAPAAQLITPEVAVAAKFGPAGVMTWGQFSQAAKDIMAATPAQLEWVRPFLSMGNGNVSLQIWDKFVKWFSPLALPNDTRPEATTFAELSDVVKPNWFHGFLSTEEVQAQLSHGRFLVRFSSSPGYYTISLRNQSVFAHMRVASMRQDGKWKFTVDREKIFDSMQAVLDEYKEKNLPERNFPLGTPQLRAAIISYDLSV